MHFDTSILCFSAFYEQCGCVGAWAKRGICRQRKTLRKASRKQRQQFEELKWQRANMQGAAFVSQ